MIRISSYEEKLLENVSGLHWFSAEERAGSIFIFRITLPVGWDGFPATPLLRWPTAASDVAGMCCDVTKRQELDSFGCSSLLFKICFGFEI